jgi:hypothetical protein
MRPVRAPRTFGRMPPAALPRTTTLAALRARREMLLRQVRSAESRVEDLRSQLAMPPLFPGASTPAERAMTGAVRELVAARARLAQVTRELRGARSR